MINGDYSLISSLSEAVNAMIDSKNKVDNPGLSELCMIVDCYYKAGFVDIDHFDRIISYMTRNDFLNKKNMVHISNANILKLFRGLLTGTQTFEGTNTSKMTK